LGDARRVDHVVAVGGAGSRLKRGRQIDVRHAQIAQIRHELARLPEAESPPEHQPVGGAELGHEPRLSTITERGATLTSLRASTTRLPGSAFGSAVVSSISQRSPKRRVGSMKVTSSWCALNSIRNESSTMRSPCGPGAAISWPLRNMPTVRCSFQ